MQRLKEIGRADEASIIVVYGRRRVGKTELIEQGFRDRNILKFEGIEGQPESEQREAVLRQLSEYAKDPLLKSFSVSHWTDVFQIISKQMGTGKWTLYFEELQWLANYKNNFVAELKLYWDNVWRHQKRLIVVLCGSSPSFMIGSVLKSKALYNRSQHELPLKEFNLLESKQFLGQKRSNREVMDACLSVGSIPEYLKRINKASSLFMGLCQNAFTTGGFFSHEHERIFVSSLSGNKNYKTIIEYLSKNRFATREAIVNHIKAASGGTVSSLLQDLEICGFIAKYTPFNLAENSLLARYSVSDAYLRFYYKFIKPILKNIENSDYDDNPTQALKMDTYHKWLGYAFERWCRVQHRLFAKILGFGSVHYRTGVFFNRATNETDSGYQIDLIYDRDDKVYTICEIKYLQTKADKKVIDDFEKKLSLFPNPKKATIHRVLITTVGADATLSHAGYFDNILTLDDIFDSRNW